MSNLIIIDDCNQQTSLHECLTCRNTCGWCTGYQNVTGNDKCIKLFEWCHNYATSDCQQFETNSSCSSEDGTYAGIWIHHLWSHGEHKIAIIYSIVSAVFLGTIIWLVATSDISEVFGWGLLFCFLYPLWAGICIAVLCVIWHLIKWGYNFTLTPLSSYKYGIRLLIFFAIVILVAALLISVIQASTQFMAIPDLTFMSIALLGADLIQLSLEVLQSQQKQSKSVGDDRPNNDDRPNTYPVLVIAENVCNESINVPETDIVRNGGNALHTDIIEEEEENKSHSDIVEEEQKKDAILQPPIPMIHAEQMVQHAFNPLIDTDNEEEEQKETVTEVLLSSNKKSSRINAYKYHQISKHSQLLMGELIIFIIWVTIFVVWAICNEEKEPCLMNLASFGPAITNLIVWICHNYKNKYFNWVCLFLAIYFLILLLIIIRSCNCDGNDEHCPFWHVTFGILVLIWGLAVGIHLFYKRQTKKNDLSKSDIN